jgi:hypothetical protein
MGTEKKTEGPREKKPGFAERFATAYEKSMKVENEERAKAPKKFEASEGSHDVVDPDDKHMG